MKKLFFIAFSLILTMNVTDVAAQSHQKNSGNAPAVEQKVKLIRRPYREETIPHAPKRWAPHTPLGQKQAEEARIAKFEFIKSVDLYFADGSTKGTHKVFNDGQGLCVEIKEKHYRLIPCNEEFFGAQHYGYCTYLGMNLYIRDQLAGLDATGAPTTEKAIFGTLNGHDWVDLGLPSGTKWATCNVGATSPELPGKIYAWGESETKPYYDETTYSLYGKNLKDISGTSYDTAKKLWGEGWTMPTNEQFRELLEYCDWKYYEINGQIGALMTSKFNQQSIFLPANGHFDGGRHINAKTNGNYWTSTREDGGYSSIHSWIYGIDDQYMSNASPSSGQSIRPVTK